MFPHLRELSDINSVKKTLQGCVQVATPFFIWFNQGEQRVKGEAILLDVTFDNNEIIGLFTKEGFLTDEIESEIFLYQKEQNILFKAKVKNSVENNIFVNITPKIFMQEKRKTDRFDFKKIDVVVKVQLEGLQESSPFYANLCNISENGMCLEILKNKGIEVEAGIGIHLINIESIKLPQKIEGKVAYIKEVKQAKDHLLKIGVQFLKANPIISEVMLVMGHKQKS